MRMRVSSCASVNRGWTAADFDVAADLFTGVPDRVLCPDARQAAKRTAAITLLRVDIGNKWTSIPFVLRIVC
jgi:hypothetical protein